MTFSFFHTKVFPELNVISQVWKTKEGFTPDYWRPESGVLDDSHARTLQYQGCGWGGCNPSWEASEDRWLDDGSLHGNIALRSKCTDEGLRTGMCQENKPWKSKEWKTTSRAFFGIPFGYWYDAWNGGCRTKDGRIGYATDCKGSPNNICCQPIDRRSGFMGNGWCMKCKNPAPEDIETCKRDDIQHCNE